MATINIYTLRKAILHEMRKAQGAPMTVAEFANIAPHPAIRHCDLDVLIEEWNKLKSFGYLAPIEGYGGEYCKITEAGLRQLEPEFSQDSFIHGPGAVK